MLKPSERKHRSNPECVYRNGCMRVFMCEYDPIAIFSMGDNK